MNILLTGAFKYSDEQLKKIENLGYNIIFVQEEREKLKIDCSNFDVVVCNGLFLYNDIEKFTSLKFIQATSAGLDRLPVDYIEKNNIQLKNARGVYSIPMAEWCVCKILDIYKNTEFFIENQKNKVWIKDRNLKELNGKTASIIGAGSVGKEVAKRLSAFGVNIIAVDIVNPKSEYYDEYVNIKNIDSALVKSDIVVLTVPLNKNTENLFDKKRIGYMKSESILVNISRGKVVDEEALCYALKNGHINFAVLDVFEKEPLNINSELWNMKNVIISPHNSFISERNNERMFNIIYKNLKEILQSK